MKSETFSPAALSLILSHEGVGQPSNWPGLASGITLGYGYDLGYELRFERHWSIHLAERHIAMLRRAVGKRGESARIIAPMFTDIFITEPAALDVFMTASLPKYITLAASAFPYFDTLPLDTQGALVSLVFNRGASMVGDRRTEMRKIRTAVAGGDLKEIAKQLRAMKRLWEGKGMGGLIRRREEEALLVLGCINGRDATMTSRNVLC